MGQVIRDGKYKKKNLNIPVTLNDVNGRQLIGMIVVRNVIGV